MTNHNRRPSVTSRPPLDESDKLFDTEQWVASTLIPQNNQQTHGVRLAPIEKSAKGRERRRKSSTGNKIGLLTTTGADINSPTVASPPQAARNSLTLPALNYERTSLNLIELENSKSSKTSVNNNAGSDHDEEDDDENSVKRDEDITKDNDDDYVHRRTDDVMDNNNDIDTENTNGESPYDNKDMNISADDNHLKVDLSKTQDDAGRQTRSPSLALQNIPKITTTFENDGLDGQVSAIPAIFDQSNISVGYAIDEDIAKKETRKRNKLTRDDATNFEDEDIQHIVQATPNEERLTFPCTSAAASRRRGTAEINKNHPTVKFYIRVCKKLGVLPLRKVMSQFGRCHLSFRNLTLTTKDMKAVCLALQKEQFASSLDFTGNFMGRKELDYVITVLNHLRTVFQVSLCNNCLSGQAVQDLCHFLLTNDVITRMDISGNKLTDYDAPAITDILKKNFTLKTLVLNHNEFREEGGTLIGQAIGENTTLEDIDLSWNHLRRCGAVGIAKGLQANTSLRTVNLAWNGFGFEGCVAIGDMLSTNYTITELNLAYNRINPPALLELLRGIASNKTLRILKIGYNPVTAAFSSLILAVVKKHRESALENIDMAGVVVDKEFVALLEEIQRDRFFIVNYEVALPVKKISREEMREKIGLPSAYNVDPLRMLYLLKEKMRASDFFYKINKDHDDGLQRGELYTLFDEAGLPVTGSVIDKIMEFMDTNGDGTIDLGEFLQGDKRIKIISRKQVKDEQERRVKDASYSKYSRTFQKAHIDPITNALKIDPSSTPMRQSRRASVARSIPESETEDNNHLKLP